MSWQDSFVPDTDLQQPAVQSQGWESSFVPDDQSAPDNMPAYMGYARAIGLTGRDLAGAIPLGLAGLNDMAVSGINAGVNAANNNLGTNISTVQPPTTTTQLVNAGLDKLGFPQNQSELEKATGDVASMLFTGGEGGYNLFKQAVSNAGDYASQLGDALGFGSKETAQQAGAAPVVVPKNSDISLIKKNLDMAGITPQQYANALLNSGPDDFAGELGGEPLRMQTQTQAKVTGPVMQTAREAMQQRLDQAPQRTQQIIENTFFPSSAIEPTVGGDPALASTPLPNMLPVEQAQGNLAAMGDRASDLYGAAENDMIPTRGLLNDLNTTQGQQAMARVLQRPSVQKSSLDELGIIKDPETGFIGLKPKIPAKTAQLFAEELGDNAERNNLGQVTTKLGYEQQAQGAHANDYIGQNSPTFAQANANYAGMNQGSSAFDMGRKLAHSAAGDNADQIMQVATDKFSPQELSLFKTGYAQGLADTALGSPVSGGSPASRIAKSTVTKTASDILGPTQAQQFADALMAEKSRVELAQKGLGGSNTAETFMAAGAPHVPMSLHGLVSKGIEKFSDYVQADKNQRLAQLLYATDPEQKAILAQKVLEQ